VPIDEHSAGTDIDISNLARGCHWITIQGRASTSYFSVVDPWIHRNIGCKIGWALRSKLLKLLLVQRQICQIWRVLHNQIVLHLQDLRYRTSLQSRCVLSYGKLTARWIVPERFRYSEEVLLGITIEKQRAASDIEIWRRRRSVINVGLLVCCRTCNIIMKEKNSEINILDSGLCWQLHFNFRMS
jgi:hypothetical protein